MARVLPRLAGMLFAGMLICAALLAAFDYVESAAVDWDNRPQLRSLHLLRGWTVASGLMLWGAFSAWILMRDDRSLLERTLATRSDSLTRERAFSESLLRDSRDAFLVWNRQGFIEHASPSSEKLFGWSQGELLGKSLRMLLDPRHQAAYDRHLARANAGASSESALRHPIALRGRRRDGSTFTFEMAPYEAALAGRKVVASMLRDVTDRIAAERTRRRSESLRAVMEALPDVVVVHRDEKLVYVNRRFIDILGYENADQVIGRSIRDVIHPDDWPSVSSRLRELELRGKSTGYAEERFNRSGDGSVTLEVAKVPVVFDSQPAIVAIGRDVGARRSAERRFRHAVESAPSGMIMMDREGRIVLANSHVERLFGYRESELLSASVEILIPERYRKVFPDLRDAYLADPVPRAIGASSDQIYGLHRDGTEIPIDIGLNPLHMDDGLFILSSIVDLRERQRVEALIGLADRMTTVGTLAAGVAHGINNPLSYVKGNLQFALSELRLVAERSPENSVDERADDVRLALEHAVEGADRIRDTVSDLLTYSRKEDGGRSEGVDLVVVLESVIQMTANEVRHRAHVEKEFSSVPAVAGDASRLAHAFTNLVVNAAHAIPEGSAKRDTIRISTTHDREMDRVIVEISDTGCGMDANTRQMAFDPFFTTKPVGSGVGLGLAVTHGIVTAIGGSIDLESTPGSGTRVRVSLPTHVGTRSSSRRSEISGSGNRRRVLVVDDEPRVLEMLERLLRDYDVVTAGGGSQALTLVESGERFDVIFCDLMMPDVPGAGLYERLRTVAPEQSCRVIFITGGAFTTDSRAFLRGVANPVLHKPVELADLRAAIDKVCSDTTPPADS